MKENEFFKLARLSKELKEDVREVLTEDFEKLRKWILKSWRRIFKK